MNKKQMRPFALCAAFFCCAGVFESVSQPVGIQKGYLAPKVHGDQALGVALGEFRTTAANLLWSKVVDHYSDVWEAKGGDWSKNTSLLPLCRTITELDPHFTQAYQLEGGTLLPRTGHLEQGRAVLMEGLKNNPNSWEMFREVAMLYAWTEHNPAMALPFAESGLKVANNGFSRHLLTRLCRTLRKQIRGHQSVTASDRPVSAQAAGAFPALSHRSGSS